MTTKSANLASKQRVRKARRQHIGQELGIACCICGKTDVNLATHRKDGKPHKRLSCQGIGWIRTEVTAANYARLCYPCHKGVHWVMDFLDMSWDDVVRINGALV